MGHIEITLFPANKAFFNYFTLMLLLICTLLSIGVTKRVNKVIIIIVIIVFLSLTKDAQQRVWRKCDEKRHQRGWSIQDKCGNILASFQVRDGIHS